MTQPFFVEKHVTSQFMLKDFCSPSEIHSGQKLMLTTIILPIIVSLDVGWTLYLSKQVK